MLNPVGPNVGTEDEQFFQSDHAIALQQQRKRKQAKHGANGSPITTPSKILAMEPVRGIQLTEGELLVYVGESGYMARKLLLPSGTTVCVFKGHSGPVTSLAVSYADDALFTGSWDKTVRKWNSSTGEQLLCIAFHTDFVKALVLHGDCLYSASTDKRIAKWDAKNGSHLLTLSGHTRGVEALVVSHDGLTLFSASSDTTIRKWDTRTGQSLQCFLGHQTSVYGLALSADESELWSVSADKTAKRWDLDLNKHTASLEHPDFVRSIRVLADSGFIATGSRDENLRIWNTATERCEKVIQGHAGEVSAIHHDGPKIWSASLDCTIRSWSLIDELAEKNEPLDQHVLNVPADPSDYVLSAEEEQELADLMDD